jgi:uncharacterized protein involved in exopolysaccharide biosynthesis
VAWFVAEVIKGRRVVIGVTSVFVIIGLALALTKKPSFTAEFSFLPQTATEQSAGGLASLAGQFGVSLGSLGGQAQSPQFYSDLLRTRTLLSVVARDTVTDLDGSRKRLPEFLMIGGDTSQIVENTVRRLRASVITTDVAARTTGVVTVRVRTRSPRASQEIAQSLVDELNRFNQATRQTQAAAERRFAEQRLEEVERKLQISEDSLAAFLRGNRQFNSNSQLKFEQDRLESHVSLNRDLLRSLSQQAEEARLREVRDTPVITVVERPVVPVLRDPLGRVRTLFLFTFWAIFLSLVFVIARSVWRREVTTTSDPAYDTIARELKRMTPFRRR